MVLKARVGTVMPSTVTVFCVTFATKVVGIEMLYRDACVPPMVIPATVIALLVPTFFVANVPVAAL
ncbi:unannotated protein [freshwater metagenome]|uniref:Unannotated protein n=1 Tax=freshwater metagenome TaxID=449393 RepID=A0A6J6K184_9ZZZZ